MRRQLLAITLTLALAGAALAAGTTGALAEAGIVSTADESKNYDAHVTLTNGTVTVSVTQDGSGVSNVSVFVDDEQVGTTGTNGTVTFETDETEELELELEADGFEGELEYVIQNGSLVLTEESYEYEQADDEENEENEDADDEDADDEDADDEDADDEEEQEDADEDTEADEESEDDADGDDDEDDDDDDSDEDDEDNEDDEDDNEDDS